MDHHYSLSSYGGPHYGVLELCLNDILSCIKPSENDQLKRLCTINELTTIVRSVESLKDVVVRPFGSFISNLYTKWGDLDTFVELSRSNSPISLGRKQKQNVLRDIMRALRKNGVARNIHFISHARVPLLIFESNHHNVSCDVSVNNHMGWMKSRILLRISEIDDRLRDMVLLTKEWAKAHHINDPKSGTLNSYSLCLLVIFHFQTCKPAILPPLKDIYEGNFFDIIGTWSSLERQIDDVCAANIARFKSFRQKNQSTLCQLLISFFDKFSKIDRLSSEYAICTYTGQWESITSNTRWTEKSHSLLIEDPFEQPDNAARAVRLRELHMISEAFMRTSQKLSSYSVLSDRNALLASLVRSDISSQLTVGTQSHYTAQENQEKPQFTFSGYATHAVVHERSNISSRLEVGTHSRSAERNSETPQVAFSGYGTDATVHERSNSSSKHKVRAKSPQFVISDYTEVVKVSNQSSPSVVSRQRHGYTNVHTQQSKHKVRAKSPQFVISDSTEVVKVSNQSSPSVVSRQRHGYTNVHTQQVWRPKSQNR